MLDILGRFMHLQLEEKRILTDEGIRKITKETMIFPRYHQLDCVRRLVRHAKAHGPGRNYLVQNSAGSGKSNSIAWLAHHLSSLHDAADKKIFDSVIVVTDRRVLDQQLQNTIYQFDHKQGVVQKIDEDTRQLVQALAHGTPIIITTLQKFPFISEKQAVAWEAIERVPCAIRLLPLSKTSAGFHDFENYERLVGAAKDIDAEAYLIVLLGGEAGLRCGEMIALEWRDVNLENGQLCVERSDWNGQVTAPKGGRHRYIRLTSRLAAALREHRSLRSKRVLCLTDGSPLTRQMVQYRVKRAARRADVREGVHVLRHTFCSHLAMYGAPARAIQELAGHSELSMTQRYMHLSPAALDSAIQLLDGRGNSLATATSAERKVRS